MLDRQKISLYKYRIEFRKYLLNLIYKDIIDLIYFINFNKVKYFIIQRDNNIKFIKINIIKLKSEIFISFKRFKTKYK